MTKKSILLGVALAAFCVGASANDGQFNTAVQATESNGDKQVKTGWVFSGLPAVSFSSDLGFQYGAFGHTYFYGDGSTYPKYLHDIGWELSHFTKGRTRAYLSYDSSSVIPGLRLNGSVTYMNDPMYGFYGFNGGAQLFNSEIASNQAYASSILDGTIPVGNVANYTLMGISPSAQAVNYFGMKRDMIRVLADIQGTITPSLRWAAGVSFWNFAMGDFADKFGYDQNSTLYRHYQNAGVIKAAEANGGSRIEMKAGVVYDTRDFEAAPNKGTWLEVYANGSPDLFGDGFNYLKLSAHLRQYYTLPISWKGGGMVFAYHVAYQGTVAGETPFYIQQNVTTLVLRQMISEGMGSSNTIRGLHANRMIGDGYAWANAELRVKLVSFKALGQFFYVGLNPFFDCGSIVQTYRADEMMNLPEIIAKYGTGADAKAAFVKDATALQESAGLGVKIAWNENFIVSAEFAKTFNEGMGPGTWVSIGTNYCF